MGVKDITIANNGKECLDIIMNNKVDIVLLDIKMPVMNGEEVMKAFKTLHIKGKPKFIALTAYALKEDRTKYLKMGFTEYISKPINLDILQQVLDSIE